MTGDCWRTCIACLLDKQPSDVPHFVEGRWDDAEEVKRRTAAYLRTQGLAHVEFAFAGNLDSVLAMMAAVNPGLYYLLGGQSKSDVGHSVICCDGAIVWDPSLDDVGIVGPMEDGYYWVTFLVSSRLCSPVT